MTFPLKRRCRKASTSLSWSRIFGRAITTLYNGCPRYGRGEGQPARRRRGSELQGASRPTLSSSEILRGFLTNRGISSSGLMAAPKSFAGLKTAIRIGKAFDRQVEAIGVYDPYLHYVVFNSVVNVLTERASKTFRFKEQEQLHEEVIGHRDSLKSINPIWKSPAPLPRRITVTISKSPYWTVKPSKKSCNTPRKTQPWMLVLGRIGVHSETDMDIGSNTENLLRLAPCNVLLSSDRYVPKLM